MVWPRSANTAFAVLSTTSFISSSSRLVATSGIITSGIGAAPLFAASSRQFATSAARSISRRGLAGVDDIANGVVRVLDRPATVDAGFDAAAPDPARSNAPYRVFNIGNNDPVPLMAFIEAIEAALGKTAQKEYLPLQDGDVPATSADVSELESWTDFRPATPVTDGVGRFVQWYRSYFGS